MLLQGGAYVVCRGIHHEVHLDPGGQVYQAGCSAMEAFSFLKASTISGDHWMVAVSFGEPFRLSVNGFRNLAAPGKKRR